MPPTSDSRCEIYILEDDARRRQAMSAALADRFPQYPVRFFTTAPDMLDRLAQVDLSRLLAIGLDHDLELITGADGQCIDPGSGRDVADWLARLHPACPVVIHSTNAPAAVGMQLALEDSGWEVDRVVPFGDLQWISECWLRAFRDAIVGAVAQPSATAG